MHIISRLKKSGTDTVVSGTADIQMSSRNIRSQGDRPGQAHKPQSADTEDGLDYAEQDRAQSVYYEDVDNKIMNTNKGNQIMDNKIGQQQSGYQNIAMSVTGKCRQMKVANEEVLYDLPEDGVEEKQQETYEELDKKSMEKDHEYQALDKGKTQHPPYQM